MHSNENGSLSLADENTGPHPQDVTNSGEACLIDMRELTLLETGYLAGLLFLSLVLPLLVSFRGAPDPAGRKSSMRTVWTGQVLGALAGLAVLSSGLAAPYGAAFGLVSCICCVLALLRQFRVAISAAGRQSEATK